MNALVQNLVVIAVVAVCFVYAGWTLMPGAWRRATAARLRRVPGLARWKPLQPTATTGCGGCDGACTPAAPDQSAKVTVYRRPP
jgi:ferrous iron transport protein B